MDLQDIGSRQFDVVVQVGQQVDLVQQGGVAFPEHERVLEGFVLPLRDAQNHGPLVFADIEFCRTDQVADVFHDQDIKVV